MYLAVPCLLRVYLAVPCQARVYLAVPCLSRVYLAVPCPSRVYLAVPCLLRVYLAVPCQARVHLAVPCQSRVYLAVPCQSRLYFAVPYANDFVLIAPSRNGLKEITYICENFPIQKFSTNVILSKSKTKCMIFNKSNINVNNVCPIFLNEVPLPYVEDFKHLGHIFQSDNSIKTVLQNRQSLFPLYIRWNQEFNFSDPSLTVKMYILYAIYFCGSNLWDLFCDNTTKTCTSWNIAIRILFNLPRQTHRYLIESISESIHIKTMLCSRFVSFCNSLCNSSKLSIRLLYNLS